MTQETYDLFIGDRLFSSWSLRGWLILAAFGVPVRSHMVGLYSGTMASDLAPLAPARLVPVLRCPDGTIVGESLAIAETVAERVPGTGHWPTEPPARAAARWLCTEMATGFGALRAECPMQLRHCYEGFAASPETRADLARIETLWAHARSVSGAAEGWLFGDYCLADAFYTPVAARVIGYGLPVSDTNRAYCLSLLSHTAVREWREQALQVTYNPYPYAMDLPTAAWPVE